MLIAKDAMLIFTKILVEKNEQKMTVAYSTIMSQKYSRLPGQILTC